MSHLITITRTELVNLIMLAIWAGMTMDKNKLMGNIRETAKKLIEKVA